MVGQNPQHTYRKDGVYYYCRRVPKDLLYKYDENRIVMSLRTKSITAARRSAAIISSRLDDYWMSIRIAKMNIPSLLGTDASASGDKKIRISDALTNYHRLKGIGKDVLFFRTSTRFVGYLIDEMGDRYVNDYTSSDAAAFRDHLLGRGLSSSSVKRAFASIRAVVNLAIKEHGLNCSNAFSNTFIPDLEDTKRRIPVPSNNLRLIQMKCKEIDDDLRWLVALISDSGMRLSEAIGLLKTDIHLEGNLPFIDLVAHSWRPLKTVNSKRRIPLVGYSFWACSRIVSSNDSHFAFPRYVDGNRCNSNSASATLNKWLRPLVPENCVVHSFRHSFRDRLREVEAPTEITDTLGGWATKSVGQKYGDGFKLDVLAKWMRQIA
jgi:integrase